MTNKSDIYSLIKKINTAIKHDKLSEDFIASSANELVNLGFKSYDTKKFPELLKLPPPLEQVGNSPTNLAEALLWKLGKWNTYKAFAKNYNNKNFKVSTNGGIVFSAFAKHLQHDKNPIYDQHTIRALWAVRPFNQEESSLCKKLLFDRKENWKAVGSGDDGSCYELFVKQIDEICTKNKIDNKILDKLLMPFGQALKNATKATKNSISLESDYKRFEKFLDPTQNASQLIEK